MFCPKCGSLLVPKKVDGKRVMACPRCSYVNKELQEAKIVEKAKNTKDIDIVESDESSKSLPVMDAECPKCENKKAYYWLLQTRAGDEPETKFLKCTKCGHVWRDYS